MRSGGVRSVQFSAPPAGRRDGYYRALSHLSLAALKSKEGEDMFQSIHTWGEILSVWRDCRVRESEFLITLVTYILFISKQFLSLTHSQVNFPKNNVVSKDIDLIFEAEVSLFLPLFFSSKDSVLGQSLVLQQP